jgi:zinc/manganese transport system substrate-binding protein
MKKLMSAFACTFALGTALLSAAPSHAHPQRVSKGADGDAIKVVAAENFYGDVIKQLGGPHVAVTSILSNPDQDPHLFEPSPAAARALSAARLVVYNGADYDPWIEKMLGAFKGPPDGPRAVVVVATLIGKRSGDNPHVWYAPQTMPVLAHTVHAYLVKTDPGHRGHYDATLAEFLDSLQPIDAKIAALRARYRAVPVTASEPVFGYMSDAIGLTMRNQSFQLAAMNDTEPSASDVAAFERDLRTKTVKALIFNSQADDAATRRMRDIAKTAGVPTIQVTETEPGGQTYQQWMLAQLDALDQALQGDTE